MALKLEIVTPEKMIFSDHVDGVVVPGVEGEMGILSAHEPLVTSIVPGELSYDKDGTTTEMAVGEGFIEVTQSGLRVLTDMAVGEAEIDEKAVEEALERAQKALEEKTTDEDIAAVQASIQKSLAKLELKRRRRRL